MTSQLWGKKRTVYAHWVTLQSLVPAALPCTRFGMCPVEYLRYSSSRLHFPPHYLSNNSWWGGYFLRVIWRKWGPCLRPIIQWGMYCQDVSPTLSPYAGPTTVTASGCLVWGFQVQQTPQTYTPAVLSELLLRFPEWEVILEAQKAAPLAEGSFAPKGQCITGCQAAEGEMHTAYNRQETQSMQDCSHVWDCCGLHRTHRKVCEQQGLHSALETSLHFTGTNLPIQLHIRSCSEP